MASGPLPIAPAPSGSFWTVCAAAEPATSSAKPKPSIHPRPYDTTRMTFFPPGGEDRPRTRMAREESESNAQCELHSSLRRTNDHRNRRPCHHAQTHRQDRFVRGGPDHRGRDGYRATKRACPHTAQDAVLGSARRCARQEHGGGRAQLRAELGAAVDG